MISCPPDFHRQIENIDLIAGTQHKCVFDSIFQFADIAGPFVVHDNTHGILSGIFDFHSCLLVVLTDEVIDQQGNIFFSPSKRRKMNGKNLETVIQIIPESPLADEIEKVLLGCGNQPYIDSASSGFPHPLYLPFLQHAQEFNLNKRADFADFIQKDGATARFLEATHPVTMGPGKRPLHVAEQLTFQQRF